MTTKTHTIRPFRQQNIGWTFITIKFNTETRSLSITGVEGPKANGDANGSCGQIGMLEWVPIGYTSGYDDATIARLREVWDNHHLNDMCAGSPAQSAYLKANPVDDRMNHYKKASQALRDAGLNPDPNHIHNGKPYVYGSAWLHEDVPEEIIEWLFSLPDTGADMLPSVWR